MKSSVKWLMDRFYAHREHPYRTFEGLIEKHVQSGAVAALMDAGCGRTMPVLVKYRGRVPRLAGVELVEFRDPPQGIEAYNADLARIPVEDASFDLIISRSVFEHLVDPDSVYKEFARVLKPGGRVIFLTANFWDYATQIARLVPNRFHGRIVRFVEGRAEEDTFPTAYKTNTESAVQRLASTHGFVVEDFRYLSQYPNYLLFSAPLFFLGSLFEKLINNVNALRFLRGWLLVTLRRK